MPAVLSLLFSRAGIVGMVAVALVVFMGAQEIRVKVAQHGEAGAKATLKAEADAEAQREKAGAQASTQTATALTAERVRIQTVTKTLIEKVPTYVPAAADARCVVPLGFVQLHDAAAQGLSGPAGGPEEAPSGVPLSAVAATVAANYGVAYDWRAEALSWRDWYGKQAAIWNR